MSELTPLYFVPYGTPRDIQKLIGYLYEKDYLRVADLDDMRAAFVDLMEADDWGDEDE